MDTALDLDAGHDLGGGAYATSFDTAGEVGGIVFDDEDVLRFDGITWTVEFDGSTENSNWAAADLDAVMVPEPSVGWMLFAGVPGLVAFARTRRAGLGPL